MGASCAIIPAVRNGNGEIADSRLFADLLSVTRSREKTKDIYYRVKHSHFAKDSSIKFDDITGSIRT